MNRGLRWLLLMAAVATGGAGCHQSLGERCQVDSDCDNGLFCEIPTGGNRLTGGTCQSFNRGDLGVRDLAMPGVDLGGPG